MSQPTRDQIDAALSTPPRDMRDAVWTLVYAQAILRGGAGLPAAADREDLDVLVQKAHTVADFAVERMSVPAHRRAEVGLA